MKSIFNFLLLISCLTFLYSCNKKELAETDFPRLKTLEITMASDTGAMFNGEFLTVPGNCEIEDYGFLWSDAKDFTSYYEKLSLGKFSHNTKFKAFANRALIEGKTYYIKAYAKINSTIIFGNELTFKSLGCHAPVITSIFPASGSWGDTITIKGKYLSTIENQIRVYFNNYQTIILHNPTDTLTKVILPYNLDSTKNRISVKYDNVIYPSNQIFTLNPKIKITSISPNSGQWNSLIRIRGQYLSFTTGIYFGDMLASVISKTDSVIEVKVPHYLGESADIYAKFFDFKIMSPVKFYFNSGELISLSPLRGTQGMQIKIKCYNVPTSLATLSISNSNLIIQTFTDSTITATIPKLNLDGAYPIVLKAGLLQLTFPHLFVYVTPKLTKISDACYGDTLTIFGENLDVLINPKVSLGFIDISGFTLNILARIESSIKVKVPTELDPVFNQVFITSDYINFTPFAFNRCQNLANPFSVYYSTPDLTFSSSNKGVFLKGTDNNLAYIYSGTNKKSVYNHNTKTLSSSTASFPTLNNYKAFEIGLDRYVFAEENTDSNSFYLFNSQIPSFTLLGNFPGDSRKGAAVFTINNKGYIAGGYGYTDITNDLWEYDPSDPIWRKKKTLTNTNIFIPYFASVYNGEAYIFQGNNIWKYNPVSNALTKEVSSPDLFTYQTPYPFFAKDGKIYVKGGQFTKNQCWEYNTKTNNWRYVATFSSEADIRYSYIIGGKCYFINNESQFEIIEFDPSLIK
jgi:hypothetical protein